jgi:hypothetical protein
MEDVIVNGLGESSCRVYSRHFHSATMGRRRETFSRVASNAAYRGCQVAMNRRFTGVVRTANRGMLISTFGDGSQTWLLIDISSKRPHAPSYGLPANGLQTHLMKIKDKAALAGVLSLVHPTRHLN